MQVLLGSTYGVNKANGNIVVQADAIPYFHADYYTAKEMSNRLYKNKSSVESGLVTGTQWDMMMKYMQDNGVAITGANCNWGNFDDITVDEITGYYAIVDTSYKNTNEFKDGNAYSTNGEKRSHTLLTTGASEKVKKMNLYDVAGNLWEWTDEASYEYKGSNTTLSATPDCNTFMIRGGSFDNFHDSSFSVCSRANCQVVNSSTSLGFRIVLYIK